MLADSTHRSPQLPSETVEPLQLQPSAILSSQNPSPVPTTYDERNYPQEDDSDTNSENDNEEQNPQQNIAPIPIPDPIHMPKQEMKCYPKRTYLKMKMKMKDHIPQIQIIQSKIIQNLQTQIFHWMKYLNNNKMTNPNLVLQIQTSILL